jgi:hypothetical protein
MLKAAPGRDSNGEELRSPINCQKEAKAFLTNSCVRLEADYVVPLT